MTINYGNGTIQVTLNAYKYTNIHYYHNTNQRCCQGIFLEAIELVFELMNFSSTLVQTQSVNEIVKCNDLTSNYGLILTEAQAAELVETRSYSLKKVERIEFGGGVINKIIKEFCDSPYLSMHNYAETLHELVEMFYYYKNETLDLVSDDELISFMHKKFDGVCQGSLELLFCRELEKMARNLHCGYAYDYSEDNHLDEDEEDEEGEYEDGEY